MEKIIDPKGSQQQKSRGGSSSALGNIRSTRAQDLRFRSNRDLLKPKSSNNIKSSRASTPLTPVVSKRPSSTASAGVRPPVPKAEEKKKPAESRNEKRESVQKSKKSEPVLQRERTREVIHPKILVKESEEKTKRSGAFEYRPNLKKSQTFIICKGAKEEEAPRREVQIARNESPCDSDSEEELISPKTNPLTHNDSFCLIAKVSQNWTQKNKSDDDKIFQFGLISKNKKRRKNDKGILKYSGRDLKSVDSLEKIESEKIVRFSDELIRKRKVQRKVIRRKRRLENALTAAWFRGNKLFHKYLQLLRSRSAVFFAEQDRLKAIEKAEEIQEIIRGPARVSRFVKGKTKEYSSY